MFYGDLHLIDILIFAGIAAFLFFRLGGVLGKKTGFEEKNKQSISSEEFEKKTKQDEIKIGLNQNTFVVYEKYDNNDIFIPSVMTIDYYVENKINSNNNGLFRTEIINNFKSDDSKNKFGSSAINILNSNIGNTNIMKKFKQIFEMFLEIKIICIFTIWIH